MGGDGFDSSYEGSADLNRSAGRWYLIVWWSIFGLGAALHSGRSLIDRTPVNRYLPALTVFALFNIWAVLGAPNSFRWYWGQTLLYAGLFLGLLDIVLAGLGLEIVGIEVGSMLIYGVVLLSITGLAFIGTTSVEQSEE